MPGGIDVLDIAVNGVQMITPGRGMATSEGIRVTGGLGIVTGPSAAEIFVSTDIAYFQGYDRGATAWREVALNGLHISLRTQGVERIRVDGSTGVITLKSDVLLQKASPNLNLRRTAGDQGISIAFLDGAGVAMGYLAVSTNAGNGFVSPASGANSLVLRAESVEMIFAQGAQRYATLTSGGIWVFGTGTTTTGAAAGGMRVQGASQFDSTVTIGVAGGANPILYVNQIEQKDGGLGGGVRFSSSIYPSAGLSHQIGNATLRWNTIYSAEGNFSGAVTISGQLTLGNQVVVPSLTRIHLTGAGANYAAIYADANGPGTSRFIVFEVSGGTFVQFRNDSTVGNAVMPGVDNVTSLGTASNRWTVVYATTGAINTSARKYKDIEYRLTPEDGLRAVVAIPVYRYTRKDSPNRNFVGPVLDEIPEWLRPNGDGESWDSDNLLAANTLAIQALAARLQTLESRA